MNRKNTSKHRSKLKKIRKAKRKMQAASRRANRKRK